MEIYKLTGEFRDDSGKGSSRKTRATGRIPGILYGHKQEPLSLTVDEAAMRGILNTQPDSPIVDIDISGKEESNAVVRDVQRHPATGKLLHIDFQRISLDEKVNVDVPVRLEGDPAGVKEQGGVLEQGVRSIAIRCLPREIPDAITLDISDLRIGDALRVGDLVDKYPTLEIEEEQEHYVATVVPPRVEVVKTEEEEEAAEGAEPELVQKDGEEKAEESGEE